jgi:hypothetical protein
MDSVLSVDLHSHMTKQILSIKEAAHVSGLSMYAIREGIKQGLFPAFRINGAGSKYYIDYDQFQSVIRKLSCPVQDYTNDDTVHNGIRRING